MTLRNSAIDLSKRKHPILIGKPLPTTSRTAEREIEITEKFGLGRLLFEPPDLEKIQQRLFECLSTNRISDISARELRYAPQCIWFGEHSIAGEPVLLGRLLQQIENVAKRTIVRTLASVYFRYLGRNKANLSMVGNFLSRMVGEEFGKLNQLQTEFDVFNPKLGPENVARHCLAKNVFPQFFLRSFGISGEPLSSGIGAAVFRSGMSLIATKIGVESNSHYLQLAVSWFDEPDSNLGYPDGNVELANTLLLPFRKEEPNKNKKNWILDAVIERIGDPRTNENRWVRMSEAAEILRRWLTRLALEQFLEIVDQIALQQHWEYRRAFWTALYSKGAISQAWVAFGPWGAEQARAHYGKNINFGLLKPTGKQVEPGHAVLIMRIGDYVAIDWSHNGRCVIWPAKHRLAPGLYKEKYASDAIAPYSAPEKGIEVSHNGSATYAWQRKIADFIRRRTGFKLHDREFRVD